MDSPRLSHETRGMQRRRLRFGFVSNRTAQASIDSHKVASDLAVTTTTHSMSRAPSPCRQELDQWPALQMAPPQPYVNGPGGSSLAGGSACVSALERLVAPAAHIILLPHPRPLTTEVTTPIPVRSRDVPPPRAGTCSVLSSRWDKRMRTRNF